MNKTDRITKTQTSKNFKNVKITVLFISLIQSLNFVPLYDNIKEKFKEFIVTSQKELNEKAKSELVTKKHVTRVSLTDECTGVQSNADKCNNNKQSIKNTQEKIYGITFEIPTKNMSNNNDFITNFFKTCIDKKWNKLSLCIVDRKHVDASIPENMLSIIYLLENFNADCFLMPVGNAFVIKNAMSKKEEKKINNILNFCKDCAYNVDVFIFADDVLLDLEIIRDKLLEKCFLKNDTKTTRFHIMGKTTDKLIVELNFFKKHVHNVFFKLKKSIQLKLEIEMRLIYLVQKEDIIYIAEHVIKSKHTDQEASEQIVKLHKLFDVIMEEIPKRLQTGVECSKITYTDFIRHLDFELDMTDIVNDDEGELKEKILYQYKLETIISFKIIFKHPYHIKKSCKKNNMLIPTTSKQNQSNDELKYELCFDFLVVSNITGDFKNKNTNFKNKNTNFRNKNTNFRNKNTNFRNKITNFRNKNTNFRNKNTKSCYFKK